MKLLHLLFGKRDNTSYHCAIEKLSNLRAKLEHELTWLPVDTSHFKRIYTTEIHN